jgi:hypothetical protein
MLVETIERAGGCFCMQRLLVVLLFAIFLCRVAPSRAQHCGFDHSSVVIVKVDPLWADKLKELRAVFRDRSEYRLWKNVPVTDGKAPRIIQQPGPIDSFQFWFADTNYVIAGGFGFRQPLKLIVVYQNEYLRSDTIFVAPGYVHSLCDDLSSWSTEITERGRKYFKPFVLRLNRFVNGDTLGDYVEPFATDKKVYRQLDTLKFSLKESSTFAGVGLKTDGRCNPKVVYGVLKETPTGWKELYPIQQMQAACGGPYTAWIPEVLPILLHLQLEPGSYKYYFETEDRRFLESSAFEIVK